MCRALRAAAGGQLLEAGVQVGGEAGLVQKPAHSTCHIHPLQGRDRRQLSHGQEGGRPGRGTPGSPPVPQGLLLSVPSSPQPPATRCPLGFPCLAGGLPDSADPSCPLQCPQSEMPLRPLWPPEGLSTTLSWRGDSHQPSCLLWLLSGCVAWLSLLASPAPARVPLGVFLLTVSCCPRC